MSRVTFEPTNDPHLSGYFAVVGPWTVELIRAEAQHWDVYVVRAGEVMSVAQFTRERRSLSRLYYEGTNVSYHRARRLARLIAEGIAEEA